MLKHLILLVSTMAIATSCGPSSNEDRRNSDADDGDRSSNNRPVSVDDLPKFFNTQMFRDLGTKVYTYASEASFYNPSTEDTLPTNLNPIPDITIHDQDAKTIRPNDPLDCGYNLGASTTIAARVADCRQINVSDVRSYFWSSTTNGIAGEGDWRLVAHKNGKSVWLDETTGALWSPPITAAEWAPASGNTTEANQICNGANDTAGARFLGIKADEVQWRLPTRGDYLQADINGSRYVLSVETNGDPAVYWTANYVSSESKAWAIQHNTGILSKVAEATTLPVRCIGVVIK